MKNIFLNEAAEIAARIERQGQEIQRMLMLDRIFAGVSLSDVDYFYASSYEDSNKQERLSLSLTLKADKRDSKIAHKLARKFHAKFVKSPNWEGTALDLSATLPADSLHGYPELSIKINGVVPRTCHFETKVTPLTEEEIEQAKLRALAAVVTERVERKLVCK